MTEGSWLTSLFKFGETEKRADDFLDFRMLNHIDMHIHFSEMSFQSHQEDEI